MELLQIHCHFRTHHIRLSFPGDGIAPSATTATSSGVKVLPFKTSLRRALSPRPTRTFNHERQATFRREIPSSCMAVIPHHLPPSIWKHRETSSKENVARSYILSTRVGETGLPGHGEGSPREEAEVRAGPAGGPDKEAGGGGRPPGVPHEPAEGGKSDSGNSCATKHFHATSWWLRVHTSCRAFCCFLVQYRIKVCQGMGGVSCSRCMLLYPWDFGGNADPVPMSET